MKLTLRLIYEELAIKIIRNYKNTQDYEEWVSKAELAKWKIDVLSYITSESDEGVDYVLNYIHQNGPSDVYLEMNNLVSEYRLERRSKKIDFCSIIKVKIKDIFTTNKSNKEPQIAICKK